MANHEIILGVTAGVAAYKSAMVASRLVQQGVAVTVVMTQAATHFIGAATFAALTGRPVAQDTFDAHYPLGAHIELARRAELLLVAPATADFLAQSANGSAGDLLSTLYLCFTGKVAMAPAMNNEMWSKPSVQRNIQQLQADGVQMIGPGEGWLSCRERGPGRMAEPEEIIASVLNQLGKS